MTDLELDPEFGSSRGPNREPGMNLRCQLFALSREPEKCCIGLLRFLKIPNALTFDISTALANLSSTDRPFETHLPVSFILGFNLHTYIPFSLVFMAVLILFEMVIPQTSIAKSNTYISSDFYLNTSFSLGSSSALARLWIVFAPLHLPIAFSLLELWIIF